MFDVFLKLLFLEFISPFIYAQLISLINGVIIMSKVKQLNQHRKDYVYDPKPFRKVNANSSSKLPWLSFSIGFFFGMVFLLFIYKKHYPTFVHLLNTLP